MSRELIVPEGINLIINDINVPDAQIWENFRALTTARVAFEILSAREFSTHLEYLLSIALLGVNPEKVAVVYPGEGAKIVKSFLSAEASVELSRYTQFFVATSRQFIGSRSIGITVSIPLNLANGIKSGELRTIVICDDVAATGQTIQTLKDAVEYESATFADEEYNPGVRFSRPNWKPPRVEWKGVFWLQQASADTRGFETQAVATYYRKGNRVPLNSLSTLLSLSAKGESVRNNYANKYFDNPLEFTVLLNLLRSIYE